MLHNLVAHGMTLCFFFNFGWEGATEVSNTHEHITEFIVYFIVVYTLVTLTVSLPFPVTK